MLFFPFLPTLLILSSLSAMAHPLGVPSSYRRAASLSPPPHIPSQPYHSDLVLADRRSTRSPPHYSSGSIDTTTHRSFKRFIMDADYASSSGPPGAFLGKSSSHKRDISDMTGSTKLGYDNFQEELPPKLPGGFPSA